MLEENPLFHAAAVQRAAAPVD